MADQHVQNSLAMTTSVNACCGHAEGENCQLATYWQEKYTNLEKRFTTLEKEIAGLKELKDVREVRSHLNKLGKIDSTQANEIRQLRYKLDLLTNTVLRFKEKLKLANNKILDLQTRSMKRNLIISGLEQNQNENKEELKNKIEDFIKNLIRFRDQVPLKTFHRLGYVDGSGYRPVIIKLVDMDQKIPLLTAAPALKGQKNNKQCFFYLSEQLPDQIQEDKKYAQFWVQENKKNPTGKEMKIFKNRLQVDNRPYQRCVNLPLAAEVLKLDMTELYSVKQSQTIYEDSEDLDGSEYISYAVQVSKPEDVRRAYRKLRIKYADASHITSAHRFSPPDGPMNQESTNDGDFGGGRCLLKCLQNLKVVNGAVFIIRYFGGKHSGVARFELMEKLVKKALRKASLIRSPNKGPLTRARSMQVSQSAADDLSNFEQPPSRASSFGLPRENDMDADTDGENTAEEEYLTNPESDVASNGPTSDEEEIPQVVKNITNAQEGLLIKDNRVNQQSDG